MRTIALYFFFGIFALAGLACGLAGTYLIWEHYNSPTPPEQPVWTHFFPFIFLFTHGGVGFGGLYWLERNRRQKNWLKNHGQEVWATLTEIQEKKQKIHFYTLVAKWKDPYTGTEHVFTTRYIRPQMAGLPSVGTKIPIIIDPNKPSRYWFRDADVGN